MIDKKKDVASQRHTHKKKNEIKWFQSGKRKKITFWAEKDKNSTPKVECGKTHAKHSKETREGERRERKTFSSGRRKENITSGASEKKCNDQTSERNRQNVNPETLPLTLS